MDMKRKILHSKGIGDIVRGKRIGIDKGHECRRIVFVFSGLSACFGHYMAVPLEKPTNVEGHY